MHEKILLTFAAILMTTSAAWAAEDTAKPENVAKMDHRMENFKKRIDSGKANQSIARDQAARVQADFDAIAKMIADAKSDGKVTRKELKAVRERQASLGKTIQADRRNGKGKQPATKVPTEN